METIKQLDESKQALADADELLGKSGSFVVLGHNDAEGGGAVSVVSYAGKRELYDCAVALVTILGLEQLGDAVAAMPPEVGRALALMSGLKSVHSYAAESTAAMFHNAPATKQ